MLNDDLDHFLKKAFEQHEEPVEVDPLWEAIADQVPQKKRKFPFFLLWGIGGFLVGLAAGIYFTDQSYEALGYFPIPGLGLANSEEVKDKETDEIGMIAFPKKVSRGSIGNTTMWLDKPSIPALIVPPLLEPSFIPWADTIKHAINDFSFNKITFDQPITPLFSPPLSWKAPDYPRNFPEPTVAPARKSGKWSLEAMLEQGVYHTTIKLDAINPELQGVVAQRKQGLSSLESWEQALLFGVRHQRGWAFATGISRIQINERFEYKAMTDTAIVALRNQAFFVSSSNDTTFYSGPVTIQQNTTSEITAFNQHRLFNIPVRLGYTYQFGRWSIGGTAEAALNVDLQTKGRLLAEANNVVEITSPNDFYRTQIGWSYAFAARVDYELSPSIRLSLQPNMRWFPQNFHRRDISMHQSYRLVGVRLGLGVQLQ